jgi:hypothetical protein
MTFNSHDAAKEAATISSIDRDPNGGAVKAYQQFCQDINTYGASHSAQDTASFLQAATQGLVSNQTLPDLAIAWGSANRSALDPQGTPTKWDLNHLPSGATAADTVMAGALSKEFSQVAGIESGDSNAIQPSDFAKYLENQTQSNTEHATIKGLTQTSDGKQSSTLFDYLDSMPGGKHDGKISPDDLQRYMAQYQFDKSHNSLSSQETPQNYQFVQNLNNHWDDPAMQNLKSNGEMTFQSLESAGNFSSLNAMLSAEKINQSTASPTKPGDTTTPGNASGLLDTTVTDVLAKQPQILAAITDGNGNIVKSKVEAMLASMSPNAPEMSVDRSFRDPYSMLSELDQNWNSMASKFSNDGGKSINLDQVASTGFDGHQTFDDRLRRDGNEPISSQDRSALVQFIDSNPQFLANGSGIITKQTIDNAYANGKALDFTAEEQHYVQMLHDSFDYLASDAGVIDINNFS